MHRSLWDCLTQIFFWSCLTPNTIYSHAKYNKMVSLSFLHDPTLILLIQVYHKHATIDGTLYSKCPTNEKHSTCEINILNSITYLNWILYLSGEFLGADPKMSIITKWFPCSKYVNYFRLNNQHTWRNLCDFLILDYHSTLIIQNNSS